MNRHKGETKYRLKGETKYRLKGETKYRLKGETKYRLSHCLPRHLASSDNSVPEEGRRWWLKR